MPTDLHADLHLETVGPIIVINLHICPHMHDLDTAFDITIHGETHRTLK